MRFMIIVKATPDTEKNVMPNAEQLTAMGNFNEELVKAGVILAGEGLLSSDKGARVRFDDKGKAGQVIDGPFAETKELVAGFWIWQCRSFEEALAWVKRIPFDSAGEIEIRRVAEVDDFGDAATPEVRAQQDRLRNATQK
ncbi:MAG: YciI family protein [Polyangiales bacterium]